MGDAPSQGARPDPTRTCVGCRGRGQRSALLRVVVTVQGGSLSAVLDERRRLPGRGAWLHPDLDCFDSAVRRRAVQRALKAPHVDLTGLRDAVEQAIRAQQPRSGPDMGSSDVALTESELDAMSKR